MKYYINTNSLKRLKRALPKNGMQEISSRLNISLATVSRVLNGKNKIRLNEVIETALDIIELEKSKSEKLKERIDSL